MQKLKTGFILFHLCFDAADREKKDEKSSRCFCKKQKLKKSLFDLPHANKAEEKRQILLWHFDEYSEIRTYIPKFENVYWHLDILCLFYKQSPDVVDAPSSPIDSLELNS